MNVNVFKPQGITFIVTTKIDYLKKSDNYVTNT